MSSAQDFPYRGADAWRRPRLLADGQLTAGQSHALDPDQAAYLTKVLRLKPGSEVYLYDGCGHEHRSVLARQGRKWLCEIGEQVQFVSSDPQLQIHVGQGTGARNRIDWAVEKMTELGASSMTLLTSFGTARSDRTGDPSARWKRLTAAACSQCGRNVLPSIGAACGLDAWAAALPAGYAKFVLSLEPAAPMLSAAAAEQLPRSAGVAIIVGRLSGLDAAEERAAVGLGFARASLGTRALRVETAGSAALAVLLAAAGEM